MTILLATHSLFEQSKLGFTLLVDSLAAFAVLFVGFQSLAFDMNLNRYGVNIDWHGPARNGGVIYYLSVSFVGFWFGVQVLFDCGMRCIGE